MKKVLLLIVSLLVVSSFVACGGGSSSVGNNPPPPTPTLQSIQVASPSQSVDPGQAAQFTATGHYSDGSTQNLTSAATWRSSSSSIATVSSPGGLATGVAPGNVTISATMSGIAGSSLLTVTNPLQSITVLPANSSVAQTTKPQFTATGTYFDKTSADITINVTWNSSNPSVATISNGQGTQGLATAMAAGQTTITATCTPPLSA